jgi:hypothetical protein
MQLPLTATILVFQYYEHIRKKVDCDGLFSNPHIDGYSEYEAAPKDIPTYMLVNII